MGAMGGRRVASCRRVAAALLALALCVPTLCGASFAEVAEGLLEDVRAYPMQRMVSQSVLQAGVWWGVDVGTRTYQRALYEYARQRVVPLSYTAHEVMLFDGWTAYDDLAGTEASPDGLLTQWAEDYYVTHDWSAYGQQILTMVPGDQVVINGRLIEVTNIFDYPKDAYLDELRAIVDARYVILQTCEPNSDLNRIVVGLPTGA